MIYKASDSVLPKMVFRASPTEIKVEITENKVLLTIGNRDWAWGKESGHFIGSGSMLDVEHVSSSGTGIGTENARAENT